MKKLRKDLFLLVLGAIMLGFFLAVYVIIPVGNGAIQSMVIVIASLPITLYTLYCGVKKGLIVVIGGLLLSMVFLQPLLFVAYGAPALIMGLVGGWIIGKRKGMLSVSVVGVLHLLQNGLELLLSRLTSGIPIISRFTETVNRGVTMVSAYVKSEELLIFARDFFFCCIPVAMIGAALCKGVITCYLVSVITKNKYGPFFLREEKEKVFLSKPNEKLLAGTVLGILVAYIIVAAAFLTGAVTYHFLFPVCTVVLLCCQGAYLYYYCTKELLAHELWKRGKWIRVGLLVAFAPVAVAVIAVKELVTKKERVEKEQGY